MSSHLPFPLALDARTDDEWPMPANPSPIPTPAPGIAPIDPLDDVEEDDEDDTADIDEAPEPAAGTPAPEDPGREEPEEPEEPEETEAEEEAPDRGLTLFAGPEADSERTFGTANTDVEVVMLRRTRGKIIVSKIAGIPPLVSGTTRLRTIASSWFFILSRLASLLCLEHSKNSYVKFRIFLHF